MKYTDCTVGKTDDDFNIVDVRPLLDEPGNSLDDYKLNIQRVVSFLQNGEKVVICCGAGMSRSPAIAIGVLVKHFKMDYYDAYNLVREKNPPTEIEPCHISALKKLLNVKDTFQGKELEPDKHKCLNQLMDGDYYCEVCNPDYD